MKIPIIVYLNKFPEFHWVWSKNLLEDYNYKLHPTSHTSYFFRFGYGLFLTIFQSLGEYLW